MWEKMAKYNEKVYGTFVDWGERFFICPECGEPIYEEDLEDACCPACEFADFEIE